MPRIGWALACVMVFLADCAASSPEPQETPAPTAPDVVPDPVPVLPDIDVAPPIVQPTSPPPPDSVRATQFVAVGRAIRGDPDGVLASVSLFEAALQLDPVSRDALWELGWSYQLLERWDDALRTWSALGRLDPDHRGLTRYVPIVEMRRDKAARTTSLNAILEPEVTPRRGERVTIAAVGDIQMGMGWPEDATRLPPDSGNSMFARVAHLLRHPDVTFGNLETVLADSGDSTKCRRGSSNCYAFRAPTIYAGALREVGIDVVSTSNNHANDFGRAGLASTVAALESAYVRPAGTLRGVASWETRGLRIALIAFSTGEGPYRVQAIDAATHSVREADTTHDLVIVSFHGGAEGSGATRVPKRVETAFGENRGDVYRFARTLVDAGADLILGHGPHVLRGMEAYRGRLIAYSLGNFAAWHGFNLRGPLGISVVLEATLAPNGVVTDATIHPVFLETPGIPTPDPQRRAIEVVRELSRLDFGDPLFDEDGRLNEHSQSRGSF